MGCFCAVDQTCRICSWFISLLLLHASWVFPGISQWWPIQVLQTDVHSVSATTSIMHSNMHGWSVLIFSWSAVAHVQFLAECDQRGVCQNERAMLSLAARLP